jgi:general secretion pathway protein D
MNRCVESFTKKAFEKKRSDLKNRMAWGWVLMGLLVASGCRTARVSFHRAEELHAEGKYMEAIEQYSRAVNRDPKEARFRLKLLETTVEASNHFYRLALTHIQEGKKDLALLELNKALEYNPSNMPAQMEKRDLLKKMAAAEKEVEKTDLEKLKEKTSLSLNYILNDKKGKLSMRFDKEVDLDMIFKALSKATNINIVFDPGFRNSKMAIVLDDITVADALQRICLMKELFFKALDERTILIIPDTEAKRKVYDDQIIKNFYLSNLNAEDCAKMITRISKIKNISADNSQNVVTVRETPDKVALVEKLIGFYDKPKPEVLIKVEILEVNKDRLKEYGIELSQYQISQGITTIGDSTSISGNRFNYLDSSDFSYTLPSVLYKLLETDTDSRVMARPHVRGEDGEKIEIKLGDKVPVVRTTFMSIASGGVEQQPVTSYDMQDVGIEVAIVPRIHHNAEISMELDFKFTFITSAGTSTLPPTIGNRSVHTKVRLKDGETGVMAGLLRDTERSSLKGFPGISKIPILKDIFSSNSREITQNDIILSITPYIIRMPDIREEDLLPLDSGTEENVSLKKKE